MGVTRKYLEDLAQANITDRVETHLAEVGVLRGLLDQLKKESGSRPQFTLVLETGTQRYIWGSFNEITLMSRTKDIRRLFRRLILKFPNSDGYEASLREYFTQYDNLNLYLVLFPSKIKIKIPSHIWMSDFEEVFDQVFASTQQ